MSSPKIQTHRWLDSGDMLALFVVALAMRLAFVMSSDFDGLYGQDAYAYYDCAEELRAALNEGRMPAPFLWPLGYPALLAVAFAGFGATGRVGQLVSLIMGAALAPMVYGLAQGIGGGRAGGLLAGGLMAVCGQAIQSSLVVMSDIPALFWAVGSATCLVVYVVRFADNRASGRAGKWLVGTAGLLALAAVTRWIYLLLALPWGVTVLLAWRGRVRWRASGVAIMAAGLILLPQLLYNRATGISTLSHAWIEGWSPVNALRRSFDNVDGHFDYEKANALFYGAPVYEAYYLAPVFAPFVIIGLWRLRQQRLWIVLIGGWVLLPYLFLTGIPYQNIRFGLIVFPAVALLSGLGLETAAEWLRQRGANQRLLYTGLVALTVWGMATTLSKATGTISTFIDNQQRDKAAAEWATANIPAGSRVYTFGLTLTLKHYNNSGLDVYELYYETPETLAARWTAGQNDYLLLNLWNIDHQWAGREPQIAYHWLRDERGLIRMGQQGYYTLFRVKG